MSRRSNQKLKLLYLSRILLENTDERHGMTLTEILNELSKYGIEAGRKSVYDDMEALRVYGYDVCSYRDRYVRYYVRDRKMNRTEAKVLSELLSTADILPARKRNEIVRKIWENGYMTGIPTPSTIDGGMSEDSYKGLELACRAMAEGKCLAFKCFEWNERKQRKLQDGGELLLVTPWDIVVKDGRYQLVCFDHAKKEIRLFSPERLVSITVVTDKRAGEREFNEFNARVAEKLNVVLNCNNKTASAVFERFGIESSILSNEENFFRIAVNTEDSDSFYSWIFTMGGLVTVESPQSIVQKYEALLLNATAVSVKQK